MFFTPTDNVQEYFLRFLKLREIFTPRCSYRNVNNGVNEELSLTRSSNERKTTVEITEFFDEFSENARDYQFRAHSQVQQPLKP